MILGSWGTSTNTGNIIGVQVAAMILDGKDSTKWYELMEIVAAIFIVAAVLITFVF